MITSLHPWRLAKDKPSLMAIASVAAVDATFGRNILRCLLLVYLIFLPNKFSRKTEMTCIFVPRVVYPAEKGVYHIDRAATNKRVSPVQPPPQTQTKSMFKPISKTRYTQV
jgi:hypothetical protein